MRVPANEVKSVDEEAPTVPDGCGNARKEGPTVDDIASEVEESWCTGEKCKQLQAAKVVREDSGCERAAVHATEEARAAAVCLDSPGGEGGIRTVKGRKGNARTQER